MAAIIFDFDGTIADSFETVVQIFYGLTGRHEVLPPDEVKRLRDKSLLHAAEELGIRPWKMPFLLMRGRRRMSKLMDHIAIHEGIADVIHKLYDEGHQLFIVSSNSQKNIQLFLERHRLTKEFVAVYGGVGLLNKARMLKKVVRRNSLEPKDTWYIGDEVRDVTGAKQAGLQVVAVTWGYNSGRILREQLPTKLVETPAELLGILEEI